MKLGSIFDTAFSQEQEVIVLGDWNMNFYMTRPIAECKHLKQIFKPLQFEQLIKSLTRITKGLLWGPMSPIVAHRRPMSPTVAQCRLLPRITAQCKLMSPSINFPYLLYS